MDFAASGTAGARRHALSGLRPAPSTASSTRLIADRISCAGCFSRAKTLPIDFTSTNPWLTSKEREVQNPEGHWYSLGILPRKSTPSRSRAACRKSTMLLQFRRSFLGPDLCLAMWQEGKRTRACGVFLQSALGFQFVLQVERDQQFVSN